MTIFKSCDVRGVVGEDWDTREAQTIGQSLGHMLQRRSQSTIVVGGDFRRSTPQLKAALVEGLCQAGIAVHDVGQVPTPVVQFAARHSNCRNLAIVTASHNPGKYNGIKFVIDGSPPVPELVQELESGCAGPFSSVAPGSRHESTIIPDYQAWVGAASRDFVDQCLAKRQATQRNWARQGSARAQSGLGNNEGRPIERVVVDTMGGAFTVLAPRILAAAGYDVKSVDDQLDPDFARRDPNPAVDANLRQLIKAIADSQAHVGLALDGDGDRVIFVDEHGTIARPEQIAAILIRYCLGPCSVIHDLKCASLVARTATELGGMAVMQPSGHGFIKRALLQQRAELGVEVSGHHFFGVLEGGDDGLFTALVLLHLLNRTNNHLADWLAEVGWPAITPDLRIPFQGDTGAVLSRIANACGGTVLRMDGVRTQYANGWALARASITEPAITFRFEGCNDQHVREIARRFLTTEPELCQRVMEKIS